MKIFFLPQISFFIFPQYVPIDTKNEVITNSRKSFQQTSEKISLKVQKLLKKQIIQKNGLHKVPIVSLYAVLTTTPKFSSQSPRMV